METDEDERVTPFQLQFDKPIASQIKIAEWNPEKDLLAMVTEDSKILLHRFNWQRLWTISPGKCITSLCWRPDGKAVAVGLEDGTISLHDVENGKLLRRMRTHTAAVVCLNWQEDAERIKDNSARNLTYEDRTSRFFPPPPRKPRMPGLVSGDTGFMDDGEDSLRELNTSSHQRFNILCSGDRDGVICFSIFGIIPVGKLNIHDISVCSPQMGNHISLQLLNASICKVALSTDLCHLIVMCFGILSNGTVGTDDQRLAEHDLVGSHCLLLDTSIFWKRKNELHQVAQQASNVEDLTEVIRSSVSVMCKQWSDAMHTFHEKFDSLSTLIVDHGLDSTPQEEFLSLLGGARTSPPVHQFLLNSLGEAGLKRLAKTVCSTGKELQLIVLDHLQPAAEIIAFRMGELRGLSKWRARYQIIGLDTILFDKATEKTGTFLVQVERFMSVLSSAVQQFSNFFNWLLKSVKILMSEPSDQIPPFSSELVIVFLKFLYDQDPIKQLLDLSDIDQNIEVDSETLERVKELTQFGGFSDCEYLQRSLAKEFQQMESCFKEAFQMPFTTISKKILCKDIFPLFPHASLIALASSVVPASISYYLETSHAISTYQRHEPRVIDYFSFIIPEESFPAIPKCIGMIRGFLHDGNHVEKDYNSPEAVLLRVPDNYHCVDLSLYKDNQIVLLLNETSTTSDSSENACMMIVETNNLPFASIDRFSSLNSWKLHDLKDSLVHLQLENEKVRSIPHSIVAPLAVSASRGIACIFATRKRALVYILEEDEDEVSDAE
ncbi:anaphase-promoting complex subunit 4 [Apium graveolens]|uniref:anaphase-promoting complex subunit 4 n=1 Tax=Apium graveolens TaxID=4045 RepID=UPI003D7AA5D1